MRKRVAGIVLSVLALLLLASVAEAAVLRVVVVETSNVDAYASEIAKGQAMLERMGIEVEVRVWRARFAGRDAGSVVVSLEFPNLAAFARDDAKTMADPEYTAWLASLAKMRKVVSDSLYDEVTK